LFADGRNAKQVACHEVAVAKTVGQIGAALSRLTVDYYKDVLRQAKWSFTSALAASVTAIVLFFMGLKSAIHEGNTANLSLAAGALVEVLAGINFYLYSRTSRQFSSFHICLERANRFLTVNAICDTLQENEQGAMRGKLIEAMLNAPMLTVAEVTGVVESASLKRKGGKEVPKKDGSGQEGRQSNTNEGAEAA
jgi:hypothetical protein